MPKPALQLLAVVLLITIIGVVHVLAVTIVAAGWGIGALIIAFASLPFLKRYLD